MSKKKFPLGIIIILILANIVVPVVVPVIAETAPQYGGIFRYPVGDDIKRLPFTSTTPSCNLFLSLIFDRLVNYDDDWQLKPQLAESWESSEDGLSITFHLVQNAAFHDGTPITSEDVKFTFDFSLEHEVYRVNVPDGRAIDHITAPDPYTVVFHLKQQVGQTFFPMVSGVRIVKKSEWEGKDPYDFYPEKGAGLTGSGPFKFVKQVSGQYLELEANEDYWGGRPNIDRLFFIVIPEADMQIMAFQAGEIDCVTLRVTDVPRIIEMEGVRIYKTTPPRGFMVSFNMRKPPFSDINLRTALAYDINRDTIIDLVYMGYAYPYLHYLMDAHEEYINYDAPVHYYNPTKANEILDDAGYIDQDGDGWRDYPDGSLLTFQLMCSTSDIAMRQAQVLIETWREDIAVNAEMYPGTGPAFWGIVYHREYDCGVWQWSHSVSPVTLFNRLHSSNDHDMGMNEEGLLNDRFDELIDDAAVAQDPEEFREILYEMQEILATEIPYGLSVAQQFLTAVNSRDWEGIENIKPFGPLSTNGAEMISLTSIRQKGAVALIKSMISFTTPNTATINEAVTLSAILKTEDGDPIEGVHVDFLQEKVVIGSSRTNSEGEARFLWLSTMDGDIELNAEFYGTSNYDSCLSDTEVTSVTIPEEPDIEEPDIEEPTKPDYTMYYIIAVVAIIAVAIFFYQKRT